MTSRRAAPGPSFTGETFGPAPDLAPGSRFEGCVFRGTCLQERDLGGARFVDCTFDGANVSVARVVGCAFQGTTFRGCKAVGVDWTAAARLTAVVFEECDLTQSAFLGMDLRRLVLRRCRAREVVLAEADLSDADLSGSDLTGARFGRTKLARADLRRATGYVLHPAENDLRGARVTLPEAASLLAALGLVVDAG